MKDQAIRKEIAIINKKDGEARRLEQTESEILKRLRETHVRQQQAIQEIQEIFANGSVQSKLLLHESSRRSIAKLFDDQVSPELISLKDSNTMPLVNDNKGDKGREPAPETVHEIKTERVGIRSKKGVMEEFESSYWVGS